MVFISDNILLFLAVLDHGSFSAAAPALGRAPSAISMAVANLEAELDLRLFDRAGRAPRPTDAARALEPRARQLAGQLHQLDAHALALTRGLEKRLAGHRTRTAVGTLDRPAGAAGGRLPLLDVEVLAAPQADALVMLHTGRAQRALAFERPSLDGREGFQEVGNETLVAVAAPGHALLQDATAPGGLSEAQLPLTRQIVVAGRDAGVADPRMLLSQQLWRTDSPEAATGLLEAGQGRGWLPRSLVAAQLAAGTLCVLPLQGLTNALALCVDVVWSTERPMGLGARLLVEGMRRARA